MIIRKIIGKGNNSMLSAKQMKNMSFKKVNIGRMIMRKNVCQEEKMI